MQGTIRDAAILIKYATSNVPWQEIHKYFLVGLTYILQHDNMAVACPKVPDSSTSPALYPSIGFYSMNVQASQICFRPTELRLPEQ